MLRALRAFFAEPGRQAFGWSSLGMAGFGLAAIGILLMNRGGDGMQQVQAVAGTAVVATATPTMTPTTAPTFTPTATVTPSPSPTATPTAAAIRHDEPAQISQPEVEEPTPEATPTPPPVVAGGPYCPSISSTMPPNSVFGVFTIGGEPAPAGTSVSLAFDGVIGPTAATTDTGGYRVDYGAAGSDCANRVGAAIAVVYDGQFFATGHTVGDSPGSPVVLDVDAP